MENKKDELTDLEKDLVGLFKIMKLDQTDIIGIMLMLKHNQNGQLDLVRYLRDINPNDYDKSALLNKVFEISLKYKDE